MEITLSTHLVSERALEMGSKLDKLFKIARCDHESALFNSFGAIAIHLVNPEVSISKGLTTLDLDEPSPELAPFFEGYDLLDDAKDALNLLATVDNVSDDSWGSFMEFCREEFG